MNNTKLLKEKLTPFDVGHTKIHFGPQYDGGYVISQDCLNKTDVVYSLGIGTECDFDIAIANLGYKVYQYEANYPQTFKQHENFVYKQMYITGLSLMEEITNNSHESRSIFLSMDIEGGEYDVLLSMPDQVLDRFNQICFEMHDVLYHPQALSLLDRLNQKFTIIHIHANNNCIRPGAYSSGLVDGVPNVLELTMVNRSTINKTPIIANQSCPVLGLDYKNQLDLPEVTLNWWIR